MISPETEALLNAAECHPALIVRDHATGKTMRYPYVPVSAVDVEGTSLVRVSFQLSERGEDVTAESTTCEISQNDQNA